MLRAGQWSGCRTDIWGGGCPADDGESYCVFGVRCYGGFRYLVTIAHRHTVWQPLICRARCGGYGVSPVLACNRCKAYARARAHMRPDRCVHINAWVTSPWPLGPFIKAAKNLLGRDDRKGQEVRRIVLCAGAAWSCSTNLPWRRCRRRSRAQ